jgi:dihydrofolate synthase/folylpolyglutamate synthase
MVVDGLPCSYDEFTELVRRIRPAVEAMDAAAAKVGDGGPTYFELTTAAAVTHFARRGVDCAVLEVGLGGRLDSTNVCQPEICVITSISFDHMRQLGNTLAAIAREKAGIIKPGVPVVTGVEPPEALDVIQRIASQRGCVCYLAGRDFHWRYRGAQIASLPSSWSEALPSASPTIACGEFDYWDGADSDRPSMEQLRVGLPGRHQARNGAVALATLHRLRERGWRISDTHLRSGLARVRVAARTEVIAGPPQVIVDAAHNVASIEALLDLLAEPVFAPSRGRRVLVFATSEDKDASGMLRCLLPAFEDVVLTRYLNNPRFIEPSDLDALAATIAAQDSSCLSRVVLQPNPRAAWECAKSLVAGSGLICVTGSFFLASEIRKLAIG